MQKFLAGIIIVLLSVTASHIRSEERGVRDIPGITVPDRFPGGCVDCHVDMPDRNMDARISANMKRWYDAADRKILEKAQATLPGAMPLKGRHPVLPANSFRDIPASCLTCHKRKGESLPPLGPMLHALHYAGGRENHFLTLFGGECTHCHKLDAGTGRWSLSSGPEK